MATYRVEYLKEGEKHDNLWVVAESLEEARQGAREMLKKMGASAGIRIRKEPDGEWDNF